MGFGLMVTLLCVSFTCGGILKDNPSHDFQEAREARNVLVQPHLGRRLGVGHLLVGLGGLAAGKYLAHKYSNHNTNIPSYYHYSSTPYTHTPTYYGGGSFGARPVIQVSQYGRPSKFSQYFGRKRRSAETERVAKQQEWKEEITNNKGLHVYDEYIDKWNEEKEEDKQTIEENKENGHNLEDVCMAYIIRGYIPWFCVDDFQQFRQTVTSPEFFHPTTPLSEARKVGVGHVVGLGLGVLGGYKLNKWLNRPRPSYHHAGYYPPPVYHTYPNKYHEYPVQGTAPVWYYTNTRGGKQVREGFTEEELSLFTGEKKHTEEEGEGKQSGKE